MKLLTYKELGAVLSLSIRYLQKLVKDNSIPYICFGRSIRFNQNDISEWLKQKRHLPLYLYETTDSTLKPSSSPVDETLS